LSILVRVNWILVHELSEERMCFFFLYEFKMFQAFCAHLMQPCSMWFVYNRFNWWVVQISKFPLMPWIIRVVCYCLLQKHSLKIKISSTSREYSKVHSIILSIDMIQNFFYLFSLIHFHSKTKSLKKNA